MIHPPGPGPTYRPTRSQESEAMLVLVRGVVTRLAAATQLHRQGRLDGFTLYMVTKLAQRQLKQILTEGPNVQLA